MKSAILATAALACLLCSCSGHRHADATPNGETVEVILPRPEQQHAAMRADSAMQQSLPQTTAPDDSLPGDSLPTLR